MGIIVVLVYCQYDNDKANKYTNIVDKGYCNYYMVVIHEIGTYCKVFSIVFNFYGSVSVGKLKIYYIFEPDIRMPIPIFNICYQYLQ